MMIIDEDVAGLYFQKYAFDKITGNTFSFYIYNPAGCGGASSQTFTIDYAIVKY